MLKNKEKKEMTSMQVVCFKIGTEEYGVEILKVQEILKLPKVTKLPKSVDYILGIIDLRGQVIPIINLSRKFGIDDSEKNENLRAIVVDISGKKVGLAIDSVSHVIKIESRDIEAPPPVVRGISSRYIVGIAKVESGFIVVLDIDQIFQQDELKHVLSGV